MEELVKIAMFIKRQEIHFVAKQKGGDKLNIFLLVNLTKNICYSNKTIHKVT